MIIYGKYLTDGDIHLPLPLKSSVRGIPLSLRGARHVGPHDVAVIKVSIPESKFKFGGRGFGSGMLAWD